MDHKAWIWRKKSSEKTKVDAPVTQNVRTLTAEEETIADLQEKLAAALIDCQTKDELLTEETRVAQEAIAARERAEAEAERLKQELDVADESLSQCNIDLEACMQKLRSLQEEEEQKLAEMRKRVENLASENAGLSQAVQVKEKLIGSLHRSKTQAEAESEALMARSDTMEKENAFLKYEFHMLKKELDIRYEELEFYQRSADVAQKQNSDNVKKVTKLEAECQRLRVMVRKRLPGPSAMMKMKGEVEMLRGDQRRRKMNPARDLTVRDTTMERLRDMEEENKILKELVAKMNVTRTMSARTSSRSLHSLTSVFDVGSECDDGISSSESWANALISELEHFRHERLKNPQELNAIEDSEMSLMNDFVEMERLAIVSVDTHSDTTDKDLFPVVLDHNDLKQELKSSGAAVEKPFDWLQDVLNAMLRQTRVSNRTLPELLEDVRIALGYINHPTSPEECESLGISGYISWKSSHSSPAEETSSRLVQSNLSSSVHKIMSLVEGFNPTSSLGNSTPDTSEAPAAEYFVRVFQWRNSELSSILQHFVQACNALLNGKMDIEKFTEELSLALEWILNNYAAPTEASSVREKIKKHIVSSELHIQNELTVEKPLPGSETVHVPEEKSLLLLQEYANQSDLQEENGRLRDELKNSETAKRDVEMTQLQEVKSTKESRELIQDEVENQTLMINEDLDAETQLTVAKSKLNEVFQKVSSLEVELEDKRNCCEELEATCLELQLQLESVAEKEIHQYANNEEEKEPLKGWEIKAASVKLAECQETILNLGKQLKALASPRESSVFDSDLSTATNNKNQSKRSSLRDQMQAESTDNSPKTKEHINSVMQKSYLLDSVNGSALQYPNFGSKHEVSTSAVGALAIVPVKKQGGGGFLRRLLLRKKKGNSKKKFMVPK